MSTSKMKLPLWIACAAILLTLVFQTTAPAYATGSVMTDPLELEVTSYTVFKGGDVYTGNINRGDVVTIRVSFLDTRIKSPPPKAPAPAPGDLPSPAPVYPTIIPPLVPTAAPNTSAFLVSGNGTLVAGPTADASGCYYTFDFIDLTYTGTGEPFNVFSCSISYTGLSPQLAVASMSLTLNQCVQFVPPDPGPAPEPPVSIPTSFILKDARYGSDGVVYAGEQFFLTLVILATNGSNAVDNVNVSFAPPEQLTLADGSSVVYVGTMRPGSSTSASAMLLASANIQEGSYTVNIEVNGVNPQTGDQVTAHMTVTIPVLQPERFEIFDARLPTDLTAGVDDGMGFSTVTLVNKGKGTVGNVLIEIVGDGLYAEEGRQYLGNVAGGEQKMADFILHADTPGQINAKVLVAYENVRGEQKVLEWPFMVNVNESWIEEPVWDGTEEFPPIEDTGPAGPPMWVWLIIIAAAAVAGSILLVRRHRKKKEAAEAALDEDDEDDI